MKLRNKNIAVIALAFAISAAQLRVPIAASATKGLTPAVATSQIEDKDPRRCAEDRDSNPERCIEDRDAGQNGITVGEPKVYDDALLQQMLRSAEARLAALQVFDQAAILARLGAVTGASQQTSSFGFNIQGPSVPGVTTATTLPTESTTQATAAGATNSAITTVSGLGTENVTTVRPAFSPPTATAPAPTTTFPSGFSVSASDILNEQTQLAAEINGLRLLLAGSLSDHYIRNQRLGNEMTKLKTTLGFPITVSPGKRYKNAVAIVEVEVQGIQSLSEPPELPAVTAIIPREKTYNVAAITDKSTSIGGGVATQILGFSGSWVRGHKTYYLVQDQDTVALTYRPADGHKTGFRWQFRPVLGQHYVKSGLKQTFVQLAFPTLPNAHGGQIGRVSVRTYWRKYDRQSGVVGDLIQGSYREMFRGFDIPRYQLAVEPGFFNAADHLEDLGGGQILVRLPGRFLPGTSVRIGANLLTEGARFKHEYQGIRFIASVSDLATKNISLVAHDGTEVPLRFTTTNCSGLKIEQPQVTTVDEANSRVRVRVRPNIMAKQDALRLVFVFGTRVFGYSDAPIRREVIVETDSAGKPLVDSKGNPVESVYLSAVVPNSVLIANPELKVQTLLTPEGCSASTSLAAFQPTNQSERLVLLEQGAKIRFLLYGSRLSSLNVLSPTPYEWETIGDSSNADTLRVLSLSPAQVANNKYVVLQRQDEQPFLLTIPELIPKQPAPPKAKESLTVNEDEAVIVGDGLNDVASITYKDQDVKFTLEGKNLRLTGLRALGATSTAAKKTFVLKFKSPDAKPKEVEFEVFDKKQQISTSTG